VCVCVCVCVNCCMCVSSQVKGAGVNSDMHGAGRHLCQGMATAYFSGPLCLQDARRDMWVCASLVK